MLPAHEKKGKNAFFERGSRGDAPPACSSRDRRGGERKAPVQQCPGVHKALIVVGVGIMQQRPNEVVNSIGCRKDETVAGLLGEAGLHAGGTGIGAQ